MKKLIFLILATYLHASELDQFTTLNREFIDSHYYLNMISNHYVEDAINDLNKEEHYCNEKDLYKKLRKYFHNNVGGEIIKHIHDTKMIDKVKLYKKENIYKDLNLAQSVFMTVPLWNKLPFVMSYEVEIDGNRVGVDKLEHIFERGYAYFKNHHLKEKPIEKVLKSGALMEQVILGGMFYVTGIFSYADLVANFNGLRFWNDFLKRRKDLLGRELEPILSCVNNKWVQKRRVDLSLYIDDSMNETINCNLYVGKNAALKVRKAVEDLAKKRGTTYTCPMSQSRLDAVKEKYGKYSKYLFQQN